MEQKQYKITRKVIQQGSMLYEIRQAKSEDKLYSAKIFDNQKIEKEGLTETIEFNEEVLIDMQQQIFPEYFLHLIDVRQVDGKTIFIRQPYQIRLKQHLDQNQISVKDALQIFQQILRCIYSLHFSGYYTYSILPEHFVRKNKIWKLQSLVFSPNQISCPSHYSFSKKYQPPECYNDPKILLESQWDPIKVWSLGSLLLQLIYSFNRLNDINILKKFQNQPFSFQKVGFQNKADIPSQIKEALKGMLHYDHKKRTKLEDVFLNKNLSSTIAQIHFDKLQAKKNKNHKSSLPPPPPPIPYQKGFWENFPFCKNSD